MKTKWINNGHNYILMYDWGYISYNPQTQDYFELTELVNSLLGEDKLKDGLKDGEETAIYDKQGDVWYILEGDFRKKLEKCETLEKCLEVYKANIDKRSEWSTDD